jgi:hypothetical protein
MRKKLNVVFQIVSVLSVSALVFSACNKSGVNSPVNQDQADDVSSHHVYGVLPPDPTRYSSVPVFNAGEISIMFAGQKTIAAGPEPATYTLASPPVRNQEQIGSCTAFTGSVANEILHYYQSGSFPATLSPLYLYYVERVKIEGDRITQDPGAEMIDIPEALQKYGQCIETDYAYPVNANETAGPNTKAFKTAPNSAAVSNALSYEIGPGSSNYAMVNQGDTASVISLLRNNIPVMMGFNVYDNSGYTIFEGLNTTSYTYSPLTSSGSLKSGLKLLGGHANVIIGYDNNKQAFLMENSWGTSWGNAGYWYLPYSVFQSSKIVPTGNVYWATL